ncbi:MAG TPA: LytTR family DNA-binding domain-containing protein [Bacilli bacterium]|nr:LytTR family DNA-binding domain-containing protein [Bacilli bacterium]
MVEFIICDDDKRFLEKVVNVVNKIMLKKDFEYSISKFDDYDSKFIKYLSKKENPRIYILDIETPSRSGINVGKVIRKDDIESPIIYLTGHEELGNLLLRKDINFMSFINKFEGFENRLNKGIENSLNSLGKKKFLEIKDKKVCYRFSLNNILYITRDSVERKTLIHTEGNVHSVNKSLTDIANLLDDRFIQTHRSCYINKDRAVEINYRKRKVFFDTGAVIDMVSSNYKLEDYINVD